MPAPRRRPGPRLPDARQASPGRSRGRAAAGRCSVELPVADLATVGYYLAYVRIIGRTLTGALTIADLTFLAGSFRRLRNLLEGLLASFSSTAAEALYLDDLFDFFRVGCAPISMYPKHYPLVARGCDHKHIGVREPLSRRFLKVLSFAVMQGSIPSQNPGRIDAPRRKPMIVQHVLDNY